MNLTSINPANNARAKANFGSVNSFGQSLLSRVTAPLFAEPPENRVLVLPMANGDRLYIFDYPENTVPVTQQTINQNHQKILPSKNTFNLVA